MPVPFFISFSNFPSQAKTNSNSTAATSSTFSGSESPLARRKESFNMFASIKNALIKHWTVVLPTKSEKEIEAEKSLICLPILFTDKYLTIKAIPFNRWYLFVASFLIQFCCGSLYSWSVWNIPLDTEIYNNAKAGKAVIAFYTAVGMFGTTTAILGPWLERNGPRLGMLLGTTAFLCGNLVAAISIHHQSIVGVYLGYGILGGFGLGLNYISPVSALQKWFPDLRGTASGFAVGGFGAGSVVWGKVYLPTKDAFGLAGAFAVLGCVMAAVMFISAITLRVPPPGFQVGGLDIHGEEVHAQADSESPKNKLDDEHPPMYYKEEVTPVAEVQTTGVHITEQTASVIDKDDNGNEQSASLVPAEEKKSVKSLTLLDSIFSFEFGFMYVMFFANQLFGLVVLSRLSDMCVQLFGQSKTEGANVVAINGVFNSCGRLFLPMISDLAIRFFKVNPPFARKVIFFCTLLVQTIIVSTLPALINDQNYYVFLAEVWILTLTYGGGFGTIPCFLTDMFGAYNIGAMHGLILTAWSIGGVGGGLGFTSVVNNAVAAGETLASAYITNFKWILGVLIVGFFALFFVRTSPADRFAPGYRYSVCGKTIIKL